MSEIPRHPEFEQAVRRDIEYHKAELEAFLQKLPGNILPHVVLKVYGDKTDIVLTDEAWIRC